MAFENLFIRTKKSIGSIKLDAVVSESHSNTVSITRNAIEFGAQVSDHAVIEPKKITISGRVSDTPLGLAAVTSIIDKITGLFGSSTSSNSTRSITAYNALVALQEAREPLQIQTKLKLYENMLITSIAVTQDKNSSRVIDVVIDLEEVIIVSSQVSFLSEAELKEATKIQAASTVEKGRVATKDKVRTSVLKNVADWVRQ